MSSNRRRIAAQRRKKQTGSQVDREPEFITVGIARRPHGLAGEMIVRVLTDFPERLQTGSKLYLGEKQQPVTIRGRRDHNEGLLLAFEEFPTRESLDHYRNAPLFVRVADRPDLDSGEYYHHQLLGLRVVDADGRAYGVLSDILETGANDVYLVRDEAGEEILFPAIAEVVTAIELEQQRVIVKPLAGLIPGED